MATRSEQLQEVVQNVKLELGEAETIMIIAADGTVFASNASGSETAKVGAMIATFVGLSRKACRALKRGEPIEGLIKGENGFIAIYPAGEKASLGVTIMSEANLAMLNLVCQEAAEKIAVILGE